MGFAAHSFTGAKKGNPRRGSACFASGRVGSFHHLASAYPHHRPRVCGFRFQIVAHCQSIASAAHSSRRHEARLAPVKSSAPKYRLLERYVAINVNDEK
jgi:hypothetical protein